MPKICESPSKPEVIVLTDIGNPEGAEMALKNGAWDYLIKPFSQNEFELQLLRALQYHQGKIGSPVLEGACGVAPLQLEVKCPDAEIVGQVP